MDEDTGRLINFRQLMRDPKYKKNWSNASVNEFVRLANGFDSRIKNLTNTIKFIRKKDVLIAIRKDVAYGSFVCSVRNDKYENNRTSFVVGGDQIKYPSEISIPTSDMLVAKLLFNSVLSTRHGKFMTMDILKIYLLNPLKRPEYICISIKDIPHNITNEYKLREIADKNG